MLQWFVTPQSKHRGSDTGIGDALSALLFVFLLAAAIGPLCAVKTTVRWDRIGFVGVMLALGAACAWAGHQYL